jgi:hypothetical protein
MLLHAFPAGPSPSQLELLNITVQGSDVQFYRSFAANGIAYLWPYLGRQRPMETYDVFAADNYCAMLGGHLPSIHDLAHVEHLSGVYAALWPVYQLSSVSRIFVGMPAVDAPTNSLDLWTDYSPMTWPGAGACSYPWALRGWLNTAVTGELGFADIFWSPASSFAVCAGEQLGHLREVALVVGQHHLQCAITCAATGFKWVTVMTACVPLHGLTQARVTNSTTAAAAAAVAAAAAAVNYTASAVASSEHAVMNGNRTWTLYTAQADYAAATDICSSQGLQLVSVHSASDNEVLAALAAKYRKWSAGFAVNGTLLLGLRFNASTQAYAWQDGSRGDWSPFGAKGMPVPPEGKDCVAILASGWWQPVSCTRLPGSFACQSGDYGMLARDYPQVKLGVSNFTASWAQLWRPDGDLSGNDTSVNTSMMSNTTAGISHLEECFVGICGAISQYNISGSNDTFASLQAPWTGPYPWAKQFGDGNVILTDFFLGYPACIKDKDGWPLAKYLMNVGYSSDICQNATHQSNITDWLRSLVHSADTSHATGYLQCRPVRPQLRIRHCKLQHVDCAVPS